MHPAAFLIAEKASASSTDGLLPLSFYFNVSRNADSTSDCNDSLPTAPSKSSTNIVLD